MTLQNVRGFTLIEMLIVVLMIGVVATIAIPRALKSTPGQEVTRTARQLSRDLEQARMRAISAKRKVRVKFDVANAFYTAYMDTTEDRSGVIAEEVEEIRASRILARGSEGGKPGVKLPKHIEFGVSGVSQGPLGAPIDADGITMDPPQVEFDARGMVTPLGGGGVVYLTHDKDENTVAAVTISGAGAFESWRYIGGEWVR